MKINTPPAPLDRGETVNKNRLEKTGSVKKKKNTPLYPLFLEGKEGDRYESRVISDIIN